MTAKKPGGRKPGKAKRPKLEKETVKDLDVRKDEEERVKGGSQRACYKPPQYSTS
jgi:hypothetical protein